MLYIYFFGGGGVGEGCRGIGGGVGVAINANRLLFQKARYIYLCSIPPVRSSYTLNPDKV